MGAMVVALGFAVLFNFIILRIKWNKGNYIDVAVDVIMLVILNAVFGGSILGVVSATAGSTLISLYLIWFPLKPFKDSAINIYDFFADVSKDPSKMAAKFDKLFE
jgi:hypothetical protein